ncbi:MAG: N-acetylmuramoyl-L-alanine amidase family protein [Clostridium sp.]
MLKRNMRRLWIGVAAALVVMGSALTVYADTPIVDIRVTFSNNYDSVGGTILEPTVLAGGSGYEVAGVSWSKELDKWKPGNKITAEVMLTPLTGRSFYSNYKAKKVSISGADFISAKRDDEDGSLTLKVNYRPVVQLGMTEKAGWSDATKTRAVWKKVPYATAYQLRLYRGNDEYVKTITMEGTTVDLTESLTKESNYFYEVRATAKDSSDSNYMRSGEYVTSEDTFVENLGETGGRWSQYSDGYKYTDTQGIPAVNGWRYIMSNWYYFNENGYAATGWCAVGGKWYYMNGEGKMQTGWLNLNNKWYYTDATGAMVVGWYQTTPVDWYYFYQDGSMAAGTVVDGYVISATGKMQ